VCAQHLNDLLRDCVELRQRYVTATPGYRRNARRSPPLPPSPARPGGCGP
jgi:hypothetical protein